MTIDRRTVVSLVVVATLVTSALPVGTAEANHGGDWYTLRQPGADVCYEVQTFTAHHEKMVPEVEVRGTNAVGDVTGPYRDPDWSGFETIESIMDYRYRHYPTGSDHVRGQTEYYAPYLDDQYVHEGWGYGTYGLYNWSENGESHLFFYENARGEVSLVIRHDRLYENTATASHRKYNGEYGGIEGDGFFEPAPGNGTATWDFYDLPTGEWAYIDDTYPREDMDDYYADGDGVRYGHREAEYESEPLREFSGGDFHVEWVWESNGTDGGAYRGLQNLAEGESFVVVASFTNVDTWEVRHNDGTTNGTQLELDVDSELVVQRGQQCPDASRDTRFGRM